MRLPTRTHQHQSSSQTNKEPKHIHSSEFSFPHFTSGGSTLAPNISKPPQVSSTINTVEAFVHRTNTPRDKSKFSIRLLSRGNGLLSCASDEGGEARVSMERFEVWIFINPQITLGWQPVVHCPAQQRKCLIAPTQVGLNAPK